MGYGRNPAYPDDLPLSAYCQMEGCVGRGTCPRCGETNYRLMGYYGALARWGKVWDTTEEETEKRFTENRRKQDGDET